MAVIIVEHTFSGNMTLDSLGLWVIPITVVQNDRPDERRTVKVLLDTGAQRTILSSDLQEWLNLQTVGLSVTGRGITGSSRYSQKKIDTLEIGSILFTEIEILMGQLPEPYKKYQIDGLLGGDILKNLRVILDYPDRYLRIEKTIVSR